jgi:aminomethyltransferase
VLSRRGIVDDLLVYRINQKEFMIVVNASNKDKDFAWMKDNNPFGVDIVDESDDYSLLAEQDRNRKNCSKNLQQTSRSRILSFLLCKGCKMLI